jgi:hypothetical protein
VPRKDTTAEEIVVGLARRKSGGTLFSKRKVKKITDLAELNAHELSWARDYAAVLKAVGYSWRYISDSLNIQTGLVKAWGEDDDFQAKVAIVAADKVAGAVNHMKDASVELTEGLLEIARHEPDAKIRLNAIVEGLDRVGITKVNKSESVVTKTEQHQHELSDDFFSKLEALPLETQKRIAQLTTELDAIVSEASGHE